MLDDLKMYTRFATDLPKFLRRRITLAEARAIVERRLAERETTFLRLAKRGIFEYAHSPYLPLLKQAQCGYGDLETQVRRYGLEAGLQALREAGVYFTFEEYKGRAPVVRGGQEFPIQTRQFDNPYLSSGYQTQTGGTTGVGTRVYIDLEILAARAPLYLLAHAGFDAQDAPCVMWRGTLPDHTGLLVLLMGVQSGQPLARWFTPLTTQEIQPSLKNRLVTQVILGMGRAMGMSLPSPEKVSLDQAAVVAQAVADLRARHGRCVLNTGVSMAVRVCVAAQDAGLDFSGVTIWAGTEPLTPAKVRVITNTGARLLATYAAVDLGQIGLGCPHAQDGNAVHFMADCLALIQAPRPIPGSDIEVNAFYFTSLLPAASKIMLNVQSDDYGVIERRSCGCLLDEVGYHEQIRDIRSFGKLTGEGVTLVGSEMIRVLEEVLPSRFGGSPLDYQLLEEEDEQGFTRLSLIVSPKVDIQDEAAVIEVVLAALAESSVAANLAQALWRQASTLRVRRQEPIWTARGKLNPLHLAHTKRSKGEQV